MAGFSSAEILPTWIEVFARSSLASWNRSFSLCCLLNARITLAPLRFSPEIREILSSFFEFPDKTGYPVHHQKNHARQERDGDKEDQ